MKYFVSTILVLTMMSFGVNAQTAPDSVALKKLLDEFLAGASRNDAAVHDRFWAEDLIYTRSSGIRVGKAEIISRARSAPPAKPGDPTTTYTAEDVRIQQYGKTAIVAFRLVGTTASSGMTQVANFLNTGTFVKRSGKWQAVGWQSTKMAIPDEQARKDVASIEAAFQKAMLDADTKRLATVLDDTFVWINSGGEKMAKQNLIDELKAGTLKYSRLETRNVVVSIFGDAAIVRGESIQQLTSTPATPGEGDAVASTAFYTLTFVNFGGTWKAVAMHSSRVGT